MIEEEVQDPEVPSTQSCTWSMAAEAAEAAEEAPRASMMAAPRLATVGMKSFSTQARSARMSVMGAPLTVAWVRSGYWVEEWLPQTVTLSMSVTWQPALVASWARARLWSRRVMAVKREEGMSGACEAAMRALVLAGLPTTSTLMSSAAPALRASPWGPKMPPLAESRSARSIPALRGMEPTRKAMLAPSKAALASSKMSTLPRVGKAESNSSIAVPSAALTAGGISSRRRLTRWSGPSRAPEAMRNSRA